MDPTLSDPFSPSASSFPPSIPEMVAQNLIAKGVSPQQFLQNPQIAAPAPTPVLQPPPLGASLAPQGVDPSGMAATPAAAAAPSDIGSRLKSALAGVKAPPPPQAQTVHPASIPAPHGTIQGGNIQALLQLLNAGAAGQPKIPLPLGQVLGR